MSVDILLCIAQEEYFEGHLDIRRLLCVTEKVLVWSEN